MEYEEIKKVVESCHLNFLIGSGASVPYFGTLSDIEILLTKLSEKENDDKKEIIDASIKKHYFDVAIKGNAKLSSESGEKLEIVKDSYSNFISAINTILNKRKTNLVTKQANIFTTNMDLFLDYTLEQQKLAFNDGFFGRMTPTYGTENFHNSIRKTSSHYEFQSEVPLFNLFKVHGSLNWKLHDSKIVYDYGLSILKEIESVEFEEHDFLEIEYESEDKDEKGNNIWKSHSIDELYDTLDLLGTEKNDSHIDFVKAYNKLQMVNPTKQKFEITTQDVVFYELLRMYSNHLERENSVLFVFGFSFADEHIREITKRVAASNPTLLIIIFAYDLKASEYIEKEIPETSNIKFIFDIKDEINYSLSTINDRYFSRLANELQRKPDSEADSLKEKDDARP